eukprot:15472899-Alexandrium_andersonii.AAC.1
MGGREAREALIVQHLPKARQCARDVCWWQLQNLLQRSLRGALQQRPPETGSVMVLWQSLGSG